MDACPYSPLCTPAWYNTMFPINHVYLEGRLHPTITNCGSGWCSARRLWMQRQQEPYIESSNSHYTYISNMPIGHMHCAYNIRSTDERCGSLPRKRLEIGPMTNLFQYAAMHAYPNKPPTSCGCWFAYKQTKTSLLCYSQLLTESDT